MAKGGKHLEKKPPKLNKIDKILVLLGLLTLGFIIAMIATFWHLGAVPDTLIVSVFGLVGGECGILGWIKSAKERRRDREWELEDREDRRKHKEDNDNAVADG